MRTKVQTRKNGERYCAYIGLPPEHPLHGKYPDRDAFPDIVDWTYAGLGLAGNQPTGYWWIGWDSPDPIDPEPVELVIDNLLYTELVTLRRWIAEQRDFVYDYAMYEPYLDWFLVTGRHRDSEILDRANWDAILNQLGGEGEHCAIFRHGHWAVGWSEVMVSDLGGEVQKILDSLADYPVLDDELYSEMESDEAYSGWLDYGADDWLRDTDFDSEGLRDDWKDVVWGYARYECTGSGFNYDVDDFDPALLYT